MMDKVAVIGLGKLGLCWALVLADKGFDVVGVDIDNIAVEKLRSGNSHIVEDGIEDLMNPTNGRISYTTDIGDMKTAQPIYLLLFLHRHSRIVALTVRMSNKL